MVLWFATPNCLPEALFCQTPFDPTLTKQRYDGGGTATATRVAMHAGSGGRSGPRLTGRNGVWTTPAGCTMCAPAAVGTTLTIFSCPVDHSASPVDCQRYSLLLFWICTVSVDPARFASIVLSRRAGWWVHGAPIFLFALPPSQAFWGNGTWKNSMEGPENSRIHQRCDRVQ